MGKVRINNSGGAVPNSADPGQQMSQLRTQPPQDAQLADLPVPVQRAYASYMAQFGAPTGLARLIAAWAPGRINLIGEHVDYSEGLVLPAAVDRVVAVIGQATSDRHVEVYSVLDNETGSFATDSAALQRDAPADLPRWARYVRAVLAELVTIPHASEIFHPGFQAVIAGNVPPGGGMSSSAALCVAAATFLGALGAPLLTPMETAQLCRRAEERATGSRIGIMDQAASCLGRAGYAMLLDCRTLAYEYVPATLGTVTPVVFDTGVPHTLADTGYNARRGETELGVSILAEHIRRSDPGRRITTARDITAEDLDRFGSHLTDILFRRLRHAVTENQRVEQAARALRAHDLIELGQLLIASHASLRDDYEVSCPELDAAVEIALTVPGVAGARLMGAGFGGSALMLVEREALDQLARVLADEYPKFSQTVGTLHVCRIANGPEARAIASQPV